MRRIVLGLTAAAALACAAPASASMSGLEGWWGFNEFRGQAAWDWSGNGNHGQLGSTAGADANDPTRIWGPFLGALHFDGNDFVRVRAARNLEPATVTVASWIRSSTPPGRFQYLFSKGATECITGSYGLYTGPHGGLAFYISDGEQAAISPEASEDVWDGRWHFVAGTFDGDTVRVFVDGREIGSGTPTDLEIGYQLATGEGAIGGYLGSCDLYLSADLDELMVWSRALPISQIWSRFNGVLRGR
jgi:hypothetical protein